MASYLITYDNDHVDVIVAESVTHDAREDHYRFATKDNVTVALVPDRNVLSILRQDKGLPDADE